MARKQKLTKEEIISLYMNNILKHEQRPSSLSSFIEEENIAKKSFDSFFTTLFEVEQAVFESFFDFTLNHLISNDDYKMYEPRNKLLSFYYTFFEIILANKEYVTLIFNLERRVFSRLKMLGFLRNKFLVYIQTLAIETVNFNQDSLENLQQKAISEGVWLQFLFTVKFWLEDVSEEKEKTDILIEKAVNTTFDVLDTTAIKSFIDLSKFLLKEKFNFN